MLYRNYEILLFSCVLKVLQLLTRSKLVCDTQGQI